MTRTTHGGDRVDEEPAQGRTPRMPGDGTAARPARESPPRWIRVPPREEPEVPALGAFRTQWWPAVAWPP